MAKAATARLSRFVGDTLAAELFKSEKLELKRIRDIQRVGSASVRLRRVLDNERQVNGVSLVFRWGAGENSCFHGWKGHQGGSGVFWRHGLLDRMKRATEGGEGAVRSPVRAS